MRNLEQLPQVSEHVLHGLRADDALKARIYQKASGQDHAAVSRGVTRRGALIALCVISAFMIAVFVILGRLPSAVDQSAAPSGVEIQTVTAGERRTVSPIQLKDIIDETVRQYDDVDDSDENDDISGEENINPAEDESVPGESGPETP